uniref:Uncharacterized protein n=1 Tax=Oryza brachyantha TaxID=4533 RepID=J3KVB9_ORYBR
MAAPPVSPTKDLLGRIRLKLGPILLRIETPGVTVKLAAATPSHGGVMAMTTADRVQGWTVDMRRRWQRLGFVDGQMR